MRANKGWDIYRNNRKFKTLYYIPSMSADDVKADLIEHDGYPADIQVFPTTEQR